MPLISVAAFDVCATVFRQVFMPPRALRHALRRYVVCLICYARPLAYICMPPFRFDIRHAMPCRCWLLMLFYDAMPPYVYAAMPPARCVSPAMLCHDSMLLFAAVMLRYAIARLSPPYMPLSLCCYCAIIRRDAVISCHCLLRRLLPMPLFRCAYASTANVVGCAPCHAAMR